MIEFSTFEVVTFSVLALMFIVIGYFKGRYDEAKTILNLIGDVRAEEKDGSSPKR